ncbi:M48 family metallopeptidase [Thermoproteota archaeon]
MNSYLIAILVFIIGAYVLDLTADFLNISHISKEIPAEFEGVYAPESYEKSQCYLKENTWFHLIQSTLFLIGIVTIILIGGFNLLDTVVRGFGFGSIITGLCFLWCLLIFSQIAGLPFSIYHTFVIEKKYDFNRTTVKTFILDLIKGFVLSMIIGGLAFGAVLWFFEIAGSFAWVWCWLFISVFQLVLMWLAPAVIMPLFNKFEPLEPGELKETIESYAREQKFSLKGVYKMDGSRRSTKTNAFFTGFGKFRRVVLFDTLIEKHSVPELLAVIAHEIGHYKKRHIFKLLIFSIINGGIMFAVLAYFLNNPGLFQAFKMEQLSIYASLIFFGFLYTPISLIIGIVGNILSRGYEYEADLFAAKTTHDPGSMIHALKTLSVDNLSNLSPHPFKVWLDYSHPPVLQRIRALSRI